MNLKHENILLSFTYFFVLTLSNISKRKAYLVIIWILIWFFFASFGRKECNLTIMKLKHVQKAYNCIILRRECAPPLSSFTSVFVLRSFKWSPIARFESGGASYIMILATSLLWFFLYIYFYSEKTVMLTIKIAYYHVQKAYNCIIYMQSEGVHPPLSVSLNWFSHTLVTVKTLIRT